MNKESIIALPNPRLRQGSSKVISVTNDTKNLVKDMVSVALDWEDSRPHEISAALAAVQINRQEKVVIIRNDFEDKAVREYTALINPQILKFEGDITKDYEGCLSVPGVYGMVPRYNKVRVKALNIDGDEIRFKADGFLARIIQHEVDHTNGIVFIDHIREVKDAFYYLDEKGELQPLDYEEVKQNSILWD